MSKALFSLGAVLTLLSISYNALAHSGEEYSANTHSIMHIIISASVGLAFIGAVVLFKRVSNNKLVKQKIKQGSKQDLK